MVFTGALAPPCARWACDAATALTRDPTLIAARAEAIQRIGDADLAAAWYQDRLGRAAVDEALALAARSAGWRPPPATSREAGDMDSHLSALARRHGIAAAVLCG
jgi:hypothetical protein